MVDEIKFQDPEVVHDSLWQKSVNSIHLCDPKFYLEISFNATGSESFSINFSHFSHNLVGAPLTPFGTRL